MPYINRVMMKTNFSENLIFFFIALSMALLGGRLAHGQDWLYTVRPGDNLWNLTADHLTRMDYLPKLQSLNQIADPANLPPGMKLRIPINWLKRLPASARVLSVHGHAQVTLEATGQTVPVNTGLLLQSGDKLRTGPDGNVSLEFGDGSRLLVQPGSQLILETLRTYSPTNTVDTLLRLVQGRVETQATRQPVAGPRYEIWTPAATSAVRGTHYRLGMTTATATAQVEVLEGAVAFQGQENRVTRQVGKGFGSLAETGKPPLPPIRLLAAPNLAKLPPVVTRVPIQIALPALKGAAGYRAQIAPDHRFETLLFDSVATVPAVRGPDLPDGDYVLRVRALDAKGLEGYDALHVFRLHARPEPPFLIHPAHQGAVLEQSLFFEWSEPEKAAAYHFQLAKDEQFTAPLLDITDYKKARLKPDQPLEPQRYYWRVAVRDASGREGPFSDPQLFRLQPTPQLQPPEVTAESITFRWSAGLPGQQYDFQLAKDADFTEIAVSNRVSEPQLSVPLPESGIYYLRMRSIDTDGYIGPYGQAQRISVPPASYLPFGAVMFLMLMMAL